MSTASRGIPQITETDLRCRNGCEFYGNPQWEGYCSQCWRELQHNRRLSTVDSLGFDKFEEKKRHHVEKKTSTLRSILKKSPSLDDTSNSQQQLLQATTSGRGQPASLATRKGRERALSGESQQARERLHGWLESNQPAANTKFVKRQISMVHQRMGNLSPEQLSDVINEMYEIINQRCGEECVMEIEQYFCTRFYTQLFCPHEDEEQDLILQARIRSLNWACQGVIKSGLKEADPRVREHLTNAITKIVEVTSLRSPNEKLSCIVECSQELLASLKLSLDRPASADELLPALIFLLLRSNPPLLQSNINFLTHYAAPARLMSGEQAYYFTNVCCAMEFIKHMSAKSLHLTEDEFEGYMAGRIAPPVPQAPIFEPLERLMSIKSSLEELERKQANFQKDATEFRSRMTRECGEVFERIRVAKELYPLIDFEAKVKPDAQISPEKEAKLPAPLVPETVSHGKPATAAVENE